MGTHNPNLFRAFPLAALTLVGAAALAGCNQTVSGQGASNRAETNRPAFPGRSSRDRDDPLAVFDRIHSND